MLAIDVFFCKIVLGILIEVLFTNEATCMVLITKPHSAGYSRVSILFISITFTHMMSYTVLTGVRCDHLGALRETEAV